MQMRTKLSTLKNAKNLHTKSHLVESAADLLHELAVKQSKPFTLIVPDEADSLSSIADHSNEPIRLAENTVGMVKATDAVAQGVAAPTSTTVTATSATVATPVHAAHVLSIAIPAESAIGISYAGVAGNGMGLLGWVGVGAGVGGVAAAAGGKKSDTAAASGTTASGTTASGTTASGTTASGTTAASIATANGATGALGGQVGGDAYINQQETTIATTINLQNFNGLNMTGLTVTGLDATGKSITKAATAGSNSWAWIFDAAAFADGVLTVAVQCNSSSNPSQSLADATFTLTKKAVLPSLPTAFLVGSDAIVSLNEISKETVLTITLPKGDLMSTNNKISGTGKNGAAAATVATQNAAGNWVFDSTLFADGASLTGYLFTTDAANNQSAGSYSINLTVNSSPIFAGGDAYINKSEATSTTALTLLSSTASDTFTDLTITGRGTGNVVKVASVANGLVVLGTGANAGTATFDATGFIDGSLSVKLTSTGAPSGVTGSLTLDTVAPVSRGGPQWNGAGQTSAWFLLSSAVSKTYQLWAPQNSGDSLVSATATGIDFANPTKLISVKATAPISANGTFSDGYITLDTSQFANGYIVLDYIFQDSAGNKTEATNRLMISTSFSTGSSAPTVDYTKSAYLNPSSLTSGGNVVIQTGVGSGGVGLFANATTVALDAVASTDPFTATYSSTTGAVTVTAKASGSGYGSVHLVGADANGNSTATDFSVAVTASTTVATGAANTVSAANTTYDGTGVSTTEVFDISGTNTNSVIKGGTGADTFILNNATMDFAHILGGGSSALPLVLDTLRLTSSYKNIDLSKFNHAGQQVISNIEVIDMSIDTGANKVTLSAGDLFLMHSNQLDAVNTTTMALTINGGTNDTVSMLSNNFVLSGTANTFTSTGATGSGYSKYTSTYIDASGSHLVEALLQNGVIAA